MCSWAARAVEYINMYMYVYKRMNTYVIDTMIQQKINIKSQCLIIVNKPRKRKYKKKNQYFSKYFTSCFLKDLFLTDQLIFQNAFDSVKA